MFRLIRNRRPYVAFFISSYSRFGGTLQYGWASSCLFTSKYGASFCMMISSFSIIWQKLGRALGSSFQHSVINSYLSKTVKNKPIYNSLKLAPQWSCFCLGNTTTLPSPCTVSFQSCLGQCISATYPRKNLSDHLTRNASAWRYKAQGRTAKYNPCQSAVIEGKLRGKDCGWMRNGQRWELYKLLAQDQPHLSCLRHFRGLLEYMELKKTKLVLYSNTLKSVIELILRS